MFKLGASGSMNREPLSQSTDNYSPRLMSMDCPQHSGELTHSSSDTRNCEWQSFHERWFPAKMPENPKVRLCGRAPPPPIPGMRVLLYYSSFLVPKLQAQLQRVTVKVSFGSQNNQRYEHSYNGFSLFVYPKSNKSAARGI